MKENNLLTTGYIFSKIYKSETKSCAARTEICKLNLNTFQPFDLSNFVIRKPNQTEALCPNQVGSAT